MSKNSILHESILRVEYSRTIGEPARATTLGAADASFLKQLRKYYPVSPPAAWVVTGPCSAMVVKLAAVVEY